MALQLERIIRIYNRLRRGALTIDVLSKWVISVGIEVSPRQLYRDLNQLKSLRFAEGENIIEYIDEKNRKTWKLEYKEEAGKLTPFDINSFFLLKNFAPFAVLEERWALRCTNYNENKYSTIEHGQIEVDLGIAKFKINYY